MEGIVLELVLCGLIYGFLLVSIFITKQKDKARGKRNDSDDDDDEGGLPINFSPDFDLPPGICLPGDPLIKKTEETEETFA